jgi:hypothetical protein
VFDSGHASATETTARKRLTAHMIQVIGIAGVTLRAKEHRRLRLRRTAARRTHPASQAPDRLRPDSYHPLLATQGAEVDNMTALSGGHANGVCCTCRLETFEGEADGH